jgi:hypothetical protein
MESSRKKIMGLKKGFYKLGLWEMKYLKIPMIP